MAPYIARIWARRGEHYELAENFEWDDEVLPHPPCEDCFLVLVNVHDKRQRIHNLNAPPLDEIPLRNLILKIPPAVPNTQRLPTFAMPLPSGHLDEYLPPDDNTLSWLEWVNKISSLFHTLQQAEGEQLFDSYEERHAHQFGFEAYLAWRLVCREGFKLVSNNVCKWYLTTGQR